MIRFLRTFAWLRWRLMANSLRGGERRDTMERVSRAVALVAPAILLMVMISSVISATTLGFFGGWYAVVRPQLGSFGLLRSLLLIVTLLSVLVPMFIGVRGGGNRFSRLLILPIPRRTLHFVEVVSGLVDPWMAFVLPGVTAFALGMFLAAYIRPGGNDWQSAFLFASGIALVGGFAFVAALMSLNSLASFLISWLVRDRRRSEIFVLVFVVAISGASVLPLLLGDYQAVAPSNHKTVAVETRSLFELPAWTQWTPSGLYGTAVANSVNRSNRPWQQPYRDQYLIPLAELVAEGAFIYWLSFLVHRRLLESVEGGRSRRKGRLPGDGVMLRIPGFWPGTSAVALAQAYTALRTVRGRLVVLLPGPMVAMFATLLRKLPSAGGVEQMIGTHGYVTLGAGMIFGLYAAQALTMNQYGSDRSGLTMQFLQPIRDVDLVRGKTAGCAIVFGAGAMITLGCALAVAPGGSPWLWLATLFGGAATFLVISPIAAWISALFPVPSDLSKTGSGGNPHAFAMIAGMFITAAALIPAAVIIAFVPENYAPLWMAVWTAISAAVALPLLSLVARTIRSRRENLLLVAQGR